MRTTTLLLVSAASLVSCQYGQGGQGGAYEAELRRRQQEYAQQQALRQQQQAYAQQQQQQQAYRQQQQQQAQYSNAQQAQLRQQQALRQQQQQQLLREEMMREAMRQQQAQQGGGGMGQIDERKLTKKQRAELKKRQAAAKKQQEAHAKATKEAAAKRQKAFAEQQRRAAKGGGKAPMRAARGRSGAEGKGLVGHVFSIKGVAFLGGIGYMYVAQRDVLMKGGTILLKYPLLIAKRKRGRNSLPCLCSFSLTRSAFVCACCVQSCSPRCGASSSSRSFVRRYS